MRVSIVVALAIGALGNLLGAGIAGVDPVWDISLSQALTLIVLANVLDLMFGFMLGVLIRNSPGAVVAYFVYDFVLPALTVLLAEPTSWWADSSPGWTSTSPRAPVRRRLTGTEWAHLAVVRHRSGSCSR